MGAGPASGAGEGAGAGVVASSPPPQPVKLTATLTDPPGDGQFTMFPTGAIYWTSATGASPS